MPLIMGILAQGAAAPAAAGAYDLLETQVLGTAAASVTFTGLGSYTDYKHLQIRMVARSAYATAGNIDMKMTFNGATTGYGYTHNLRGNGSSVSSSANSNSTFFYLDEFPGASATAGLFTPWIIDILDFSNSNKNTTYRAMKGASASNQIDLKSGLFPTTSAITEIAFSGSAGDLATGTRLSLYGVR